jgi:hypothetical protein
MQVVVDPFLDLLKRSVDDEVTLARSGHAIVEVLRR